LLGPTAETPITWLPSVGIDRHVALSIVREYAVSGG
jgi:hypothetical protein